MDAAYRGRDVLDASGGLVIPGLINAHTHAPMVLFRGVADDLRLMDWLTKYIFPAEAKNVSAPFVKTATRLAALEMIRSGTTTFVDMYYFEDQVAEAAKEAGIRGVLGSTLIEVPGGAPDAKTVPDALANAERFLKRWAGDPLIVPPRWRRTPPISARRRRSSPRAALADRYDAPILIHLSEVADEREDDQGALRQDIDRAPARPRLPAQGRPRRARRLALGERPRDPQGGGRGRRPLPAEQHEALVGRGPGGGHARGRASGWAWARTARPATTTSTCSRRWTRRRCWPSTSTGDPTAAPAPAVLEMATLGGARALGMEDRLGSLEVGKRADIVVVSLAAPRLHPLYDAVSHLVYVAKGADVRDVVIEGRVVMRDGKVLTLDEAAVDPRRGGLRAKVVESVKR